MRRIPERGKYDREWIDAVLDEGLVCHVGFMMEGAPFVIPTGYARDGDRLLIHGSSASRMMRALAAGAEACITVTLLDGVVLARSAFHHSMNYRSVVVLARGRIVEDAAEKLRALERITAQLVPGRWESVRQPSAQEMKATSVIAFDLAEASGKSRCGPPKDEEEDYAMEVWAGVLPLALRAGEPVADDRLHAGTAVPAHVRGYGSTKLRQRG